MTEHPVIFKRTDVIYVYDSDDEKKRKIRNRKKNKKKVIKKKVIKKECGICGDDIKDKLNIKITYETFVCLRCATYITEIDLDL